MDLMKRFVSLFCVVCLLMVAICGCKEVEEPTEPTDSITEPPEIETEPVETEPPVLMEGYVTRSTLNIRSGPGADYELLGAYNKNDLVFIYEIQGDWGRTEDGWIHIGYVEVTVEYPDPIETLPEEDNPDAPSGNIDPSLLGKWYSYSEWGGEVYAYTVSVMEIMRDGTFTDTYYSVTWDDINNWQNAGEGLVMQGFSYTYEIQGNKIRSLFEGDPSEARTVTYSVNGNTLTWGSGRLRRGGYRDALKELYEAQAGNSGEQEWPELDPNSPIIGSWYRYQTTGQYCVYTLDFYGYGVCGDGAYVFKNDDPENEAEQVGGGQSQFTVKDGKVLFRDGLYGEHYSEVSYSISGNRLVYGGITYYRGTYQEGIEKLRAELLGNSQPTEPPTEAPTEEPTEAPTEAPTETPTEAPTDAPAE